MNTPRLVRASAYASIITIVFVVVITVWADLSAPLKDRLKTLSGHHWTSKSILSVLLYAIATLVIYALPHKHGDEGLHGTLNVLFLSTVFGTILLTAFYTAHHLGYI